MKASGSSDWFCQIDRQGLAGRSRRGLVYTVAAQLGGTVIQIASTAVLARLLEIADFGLVAMSALISGFAGMFLSGGLGVATVQQSAISERQVSTLFWINVAIGAVIGLLVVAMAPVAAWFFDEERLAGVVMANALVFPITAASVQHTALLTRHSLFGRLAVRDVLVQSSSVVVGVTCGVLGLGYWSLVVAGIASAMAGTLLAWSMCPWLPGWPSRHSGVGRMIRFGSGVLGFQLVNYWGRNADNLLIGKFIGADGLGLYSKAYGLLLMPLSKVVRPLGSVLMPHLSRINEDHERFEMAVMRTLGLLSFVVSPAVALLGVLAPEIVVLLLGSAWEGAIPVYRLLVLAGVSQAALVPTGEVMLAAGRSDLLFWAGLVGACVTVGAFLVGIPWGIVGVAAAYGVSGMTLDPVIRLIYVSRCGVIRFGSLGGLILPRVWVAALSLIGGVLARERFGFGDPCFEGAGVGFAAWALVLVGMLALPGARDTLRHVGEEMARLRRS